MKWHEEKNFLGCLKRLKRRTLKSWPLFEDARNVFVGFFQKLKNQKDFLKIYTKAIQNSFRK
jgi:hypothetical protein